MAKKQLRKNNSPQNNTENQIINPTQKPIVATKGF